MRCAVFAGLIFGFSLSLSARANGADLLPGVGFSATSTPVAPCGTGTPPRGHFPPEIALADRPNGVTLTVRQGDQRLCYVAGDNAEAPVLRVRQGQEMTVTLRNEITDPKAIADFIPIKQLDAPNGAVPAVKGSYPVRPDRHHTATGMTNLHVHGFAVPPVAPQDEVLMACADPAVGAPVCGHRELTYRYQIPASMPAGLYWYHPHIHGEVQAQMLMGLAGAIVVEGREDDARHAAGIEDRIFVIRQTQDLDGVESDEDTPKVPSATGAPQGPAPAGLGGVLETAHEVGCSNHTGIDELTLNGARVADGRAPDSELAPVDITAGTRQLWRILNAATDAFLDLALFDEHGQPLPVEMVARDGVPLADDAGNPRQTGPTKAPMLVAPSGRVEFLVTAPPPGGKAYLVTHAVDTGCSGDIVPERRLVVLKSVPAATGRGAAIPAAVPEKPIVAAPDLFSGLLTHEPDRQRVIAFAEYPRPGTDDQTDYYIVERKPGAVLKPYEMGAAPAIIARAGTTEEWVVENWTNELHAFHIHQVHFRALEVNGKTVAEPPLLDVVTVPYAHVDADGTLVPGRVKVRMRFPAELAGDIPFHCHLVDHEDNGMMAVLRVEPAAGSKLIQRSELPAGFLSAGATAICRAPRGAETVSGKAGRVEAPDGSISP
jgi:FtsP/CotA-like multicopper oxidase with cupredoxin domain